MKTNYKRAMKNLYKVKKSRYIYYQYVGNVTLVSDGSCIITVPSIDFEAYKDEAFGKAEILQNNKLSEMLRDMVNRDCTASKLTTILINITKDKLCRVFKVNNELVAINEAYVDVVRDTIHGDCLAYAYGTDGKSPIFKIDMLSDMTTGFAILPINCNVKDVLNSAME